MLCALFACQASPIVDPQPSLESLRYWPDFRGPGGQGHSPATRLPRKWSETENVLWKTPIAGKGWSSPVVWSDQIWMTTATEEGLSLRAVCVAYSTGELVHDVEVFQVDEPKVLDGKNSYASPTPVIEEGRVYVHFGTEGTACLSTITGEVLWRNRSLPVEHGSGPGNSPVLCKNLVLFNLDGVDVQQVVALDKQSGEIAWKKQRSGPVPKPPAERRAFVTPLVTEWEGRAILISPGADKTEAYDVLTGEEIWQVRYVGYSLVPRPIVSGDIVYICTGFNEQKLWAIRLGGKGLVTDSHLLWQRKKSVSRTCSPILVGDAIYMITDNGILSCLDSKTGEERWVHRLGGNFSASPVFADGHLYFCSEEGKVSVLEPGDEPRIVAENEHEDGFMASPAIVSKPYPSGASSLILRTRTHLYRVEKSASLEKVD